jgi:hypothetical protein
MVMLGAEPLCGLLPARPPALTHGRRGAALRGHQHEPMVGAELLRGIPQCIAMPMYGRQRDLVVGAELLGSIQQC